MALKYIDYDDAIEQFNEFIDETSGDIVILGMSFCASRLLSECDPIAYDCGFADWLDANDLTTDEDESADNET